MASAPIPHLMLVTDRHTTAGRDLVDVISAAVQGGVDTVQVREKDLGHAALLELAGQVQRTIFGRATLLINSSALVAMAFDAGLHLPADLPLPPGRRWPLWGRSVHSVEEAQAAVAQGPDYLLLGTIFPTSSKPGHPGSGLALIARVARIAAPIPIIAIGGIDASNVASVLTAGAAGVAVRSALLEAPDPEEAARGLRAAMECA